MSDIPPPSAYPPPPPNQPPPPPPGGAPAPTPGQPAAPPYSYQMPPGQVPPPIVPMAPVAAGGLGLMYQFSGPALWSVLVGVAGIAVPFVFNRVFFFLPIIGIIYGVRAIMRARLIGGIVGIVLNAIAGVITLISFIPVK
jgi:hypothetical protein